MAVKLRLYLLLLLLKLGWAQEHRCQQPHFSCDKCIQTGPECAWCSSPNAKVGCHTLEELQKASCTDVYNPQPSIEILRNESRPAQIETVFMQPQELSIRLRPGTNQTVQLNVFMPADHQPTYVTLENVNIPPGLNVTLNRNTVEKSGLIQVLVDAVQSPSRNPNMAGPWFVYVEATHYLQRVKLEIHLEFHCDCSLNREEKSAACRGRGARVCGQCECEQPYTGENCQMEERQEDPLVVRGDDSCRANPNEPLCSGRGTCVQGVCACDKLIHPDDISGQYCECENFKCPYHRKKLCGDNGRCECGRCVCDAGWSGEECLCPTDTSTCLAKNGELCNGKGTCLCGLCLCKSAKYQGPTCEVCPTCRNTCTQYSGCVECRAFGTGEMVSRCDKECNYFSMTMVDTIDDLDRIEGATSWCKLRTVDDCFFYFCIVLTRFEKNVTVFPPTDHKRWNPEQDPRPPPAPPERCAMWRPTDGSIRERNFPKRIYKVFFF